MLVLEFEKNMTVFLCILLYSPLFSCMHASAFGALFKRYKREIKTQTLSFLCILLMYTLIKFWRVFQMLRKKHGSYREPIVVEQAGLSCKRRTVNDAKLCQGCQECGTRKISTPWLRCVLSCRLAFRWWKYQVSNTLCNQSNQRAEHYLTLAFLHLFFISDRKETERNARKNLGRRQEISPVKCVPAKQDVF